MDSLPENIVLVVDDIGIPFSHYNTGFPVPFDSYKRLLELAQQFNLAIPVAAITCFFDLDNISRMAEINKDAEKIIDFLNSHSEYLPVWNHGLTHRYNGHLTEFLLLSPERRVPENIQREHLALSQEILRKTGLTAHDILVPSGHAWEPNVTDKIAHELGFKGITIMGCLKRPFTEWIRNFREPCLRKWKDSRYLHSLYRLGLGISMKRDFDIWDYLKMHQYIHPTNRFIKFLVRRNQNMESKLHHFCAHIQNFVAAESLKIWKRILQDLLRWKKNWQNVTS